MDGSRPFSGSVDHKNCTGVHYAAGILSFFSKFLQVSFTNPDEYRNNYNRRRNYGNGFDF